MRPIAMARNLVLDALGAGSASLALEDSGEAALLRRLAARWSDREVTIVDVGANIGEYAVCARAAFGPGATLHCFEPQPETFALLEGRVGGEPHTTCHCVGLGESPEARSLFSNDASSAFTSLYEEPFGAPGHEVTRVDEVEVRTLDEVAREYGVGRIDLLKVDVEGHELAVLKGARGLLEAGAVEAVQFEFGQRSLYARTFLHDFIDLLGTEFHFFRVLPHGVWPLEYDTRAEVFVRESNYLAVRGPAGL